MVGPVLVEAAGRIGPVAAVAEPVEHTIVAVAVVEPAEQSEPEGRTVDMRPLQVLLRAVEAVRPMGIEVLLLGQQWAQRRRQS